MSIPIIMVQSAPVYQTSRVYHINCTTGVIPISIDTGKVIAIVGPNGTGKSALSHDIYRSLAQGSAEIFFGHRQIHFSSEQYDFLGQTMNQLEGHLYTQRDHVNRFRSAWSEDHLKSVIKKLMNHEFQYVSDIAKAALSNTTIPTFKGPLGVLNSVFRNSRIPIEFSVQDGILKACRDGSSFYGIDKLSDGERAALLIVGAVIVRPLNNVMIIDEPEKHLHESISGPLITAMVRSRPDLAFIFTSHNLPLIESLNAESIIHVRDSRVLNAMEDRVYDVHIMSANDGVSEEIKVSIAGARKKLLFVEGTNTSADIALYRLMYPEWHIVSKGGADNTIANVRAINANQSYSWLTAKGIIDLDGRNTDEVITLSTDNIYALSTPTIENLFVMRDVLWNIADLMRNFRGTPEPVVVIGDLEGLITNVLNAEKANIVYRMAVWSINRKISASKLSVKDLRNGVVEVATVDVTQEISNAEANFDAAISLGAFSAIEKIPVKNTPLLGQIASYFSYANVPQYKASVIRQVELESRQGKLIRMAMSRLIPSL